MDTKALCTKVQGNLGAVCKLQNGFTAITGIFLAKSNFSFATVEDFADSTKWEEAIKNKDIFPLNNIYEFDDNSEETQYYTSPLGRETKLRDGKYKFTFRFNLNLEIHKELQKFSGSDLTYFKADSDNNVYGYSPDGTTVKGFGINNIEAEKMMQATADAPAWSPVTITEKDPRQWNDKGIFINPSWIADELTGLTNVNIEVIGAPSITELIIGVYYYAGYNADGTVSKVAITGIAPADIVVKTTAGVDQGVVFTDNGDGTYTGVDTDLETGNVNLVSPANMASTGLLIESTGATDFTVV